MISDQASNLTCDLCPPSCPVNRCSLSTRFYYGSNGSDSSSLIWISLDPITS
ncbi:MAG: hypothetical protein KBT07_00475 [Clostridiales bacterium]|nr:hypothetical protein [Candidatus Scatonaster coprocaballi]